MKITFIRPNMMDSRSSDAMQPLVFGILASLTPSDVETVMYDERIEPVPLDETTDLVAISVETFTARRAYHIASQFRCQGIPVILGGYHPTLMPYEALEYADAIVIGDAEGVWEQVVRDVQAGTLQRVYHQKDRLPLSGLKFDRRVFKGKRYIPVYPVQQSRGCRFGCDFCSIHAFYGSHHRQRPIREVIQEIEALHQKQILFIDDNIFVDPLRARDFFRALIPLHIRWTCQVSIDVANHTELLDLMEKSGCMMVIIGFESLDERNLQQMQKACNVEHGNYTTAIRKFQDRGIMIFGTFVFGYDYDTVDSFEMSLEFALRSKFFLANFNPLIPTPGTQLYQRLQSENRLMYERWWLDPEYRYGQAIFHPRGMTADELTEGCFRVRHEFHGFCSMVQRALDTRTNCRNPYRLGLFFVTNMISRKEILRKQGVQLGAGA
jgi:radical SAM superfamily enzyme YgiQ (UPF0313 family)